LPVLRLSSSAIRRVARSVVGLFGFAVVGPVPGAAGSVSPQVPQMEDTVMFSARQCGQVPDKDRPFLDRPHLH
jgi:hypothetical protein